MIQFYILSGILLIAMTLLGILIKLSIIAEKKDHSK